MVKDQEKIDSNPDQDSVLQRPEEATHQSHKSRN